MLLVIDVGNTNTVFGVFGDEDLKGQWHLSTRKTITSDEIGILIVQLMAAEGIQKKKVSGIIISSVVPSLNCTLQSMSREFFSLEPYFVQPGLEEYIPIAYERPEEVGADRIVNAVAACHLYGTPAIIIDFGTAITFCVLSTEGQYLGGCIFPGIEISASALFKAAEKLVPVKIEEPASIIGRSTKEAIQSGFFWGFSAMVKGMVAMIAEQLSNSPKVIATGGFAHLFRRSCPSIHIFDDLLTLKGLRIIYQDKAS